MSDFELHLGDCLEVMRSFPDNHFSAIVCDPPYALTNRVADVLYCESCGRVLGGRDGKPELCPRCGAELVRRRQQMGGGFMGKDWDTGSVAFHPAVWAEALRVARPGAMLLAFGGTRTHHRLMVAIEDAGWEIRDCLMWLYGSGFPKSTDISKQLDKQAGAEREVIGEYSDNGRKVPKHQNTHATWEGDAMVKVTAPATEAAKQWDGWGTALKPAWEPIIMARKPLSEKTIAANVLRWGTGGINVDASRIGTAADMNPNDFDDSKRKAPKFSGILNGGKEGQYCARTGTIPNGRWPANLILDVEAAAMLDEQSGERPSGSGNKSPRKHDDNSVYGQGLGYSPNPSIGGDTGGASRFFYVPKASKRDRDEGLEGMPEVVRNDGRAEHLASGDVPMNRSNNPKANHHPTVKSTPLMRHLVRLVTPPNGTVLDPFMGSGSTGKAAMREGFDFVGIDNDAEYLEIARRRIEYARGQVILPLWEEE